MTIFMNISRHLSLQDETSKRKTQTDQQGINKLSNNDQNIVDDNPEREQKIAKGENEWIEERKRSSCITSAYRTSTTQAWGEIDILRPRLATRTLTTPLILTRRLTIVCANVVALWRAASFGVLTLSKAKTCLVEAMMAVTIWLTWPTMACWATALSASEEVGLMVALVVSRKDTGQT